MFMNLAQMYQGELEGRHSVLTLPAVQLARWLDEVWTQAQLPAELGNTAKELDSLRRVTGLPDAAAGSAAHGVDPSGLDPGLGLTENPPGSSLRVSAYTLGTGPLERPSQANPAVNVPFMWDHLIYSYLIEATGVVDILAEIGRRLVSGESLGRISPASIVWLQNTEQLFFRDPPLFSVTGVVSQWRPSGGAGRRNLYWRMFGMDLPHQMPPGWSQTVAADAWKKNAGPGVNSDFVTKLTELFRQVWLGLENANNSAGPNAADSNYMALLCQALGDMLRDRRQNGILAREEMVYTAMMSWFDLTLQDNEGGPEIDAPIVRDLQSRGTSPEQRLSGLAEKVGMKPAPRARELFQLARPLSQLLRQIENRDYDDESVARTLYTPDSVVTADMRRIINLWQSATGQRVKDRPVGTGPGTSAPAQPLRVPAPAAAGATASNGSGSGT